MNGWECIKMKQAEWYQNKFGIDGYNYQKAIEKII